ncbi:MAG: penicillin acylase family protein [Dyella sp.]
MTASTYSRSRVWRWLRRLLALLLLLLLASGIAVWLLLAASRARLDGTLRLPGLTQAVSLTRDAQGTVTVDGKDRNDVSFALGFAQAQERYFAMDLMRRLPAGELAELVGPAAFDVDLNHRRHRLRAVAEAAYAQLPSAQRLALDRYRDGVNAGLAALRLRPWEYLLLRTKPQPWRSPDSLLVIAAMYLDLNGDGSNQRELAIAQMRAALPRAVVDFLLAPDPTWEAPLLGDLSRTPVLPESTVLDLRGTPSPASTDAMAAVLAPLQHDLRPGSNSFAVSGALTGTGAAILANDMHLGLRVPNIWFRARLRYDDPSAPGGKRQLDGLTLPGTPALVVGSNGQIAWGFTNSYGDWLDWVRVNMDPNNPNRYLTPDGWQPIAVHQETIRASDGQTRQLTVRATRWGPIMATDTDGTPLALAWIGDLPRAYNLNLVQFEHAGSVKAALDLAPSLGMPPQNLLVADSTGHIGWSLAGNAIPLRGEIDPLVPSDWSHDGSGWIGWAQPSEYPRVEDPADGRLWTANNRTVDGNALALLGDGGHDLGARAQQIRDDLRAHQRFRPGDLLDIQLDDRALFLSRWQRLLQDTLAKSPEPELESMRLLTANWRSRADIDSVDYTLVRAFREEVQKAVLAPFAARVSQRFGDFTWPQSSSAEAAVWMLLRDRPNWLLDPHYANWDALLLDSARRVVKNLGQAPGGLAARQWGNQNRAAIQQPLARALPGFLAYLLNMPADPQAGDRDMPRVAAPSFGASERLDVMPGHEAQSILHMPGGQSGNPLSPYYGAGHEDWVQGHPTPLPPGPTKYTLNLLPAEH